MDQPRLMRSQYLLVLLSICCSLVSANSLSLDQKWGLKDDWVKPHYLLYATEGEPLEVYETLDLIKSLNKLYENRSDSGSMTRGQRVGTLLEISNISREKCNREIISGYVKLIKTNSPFKINVLPYLYHHFELQYSLCKPSFEKNFKDLVASLYNINQLSVDELVDRVLDHNTKYQPFPTPDATKGLFWLYNANLLSPSECLASPLLEYIDSKDGHSYNVREYYKKGKQGLGMLRLEFDYLVGDPCEDLTSELRVHSDFYTPFMYDKNLAELLDPLVVKWIKTTQICNDMLNNKERLINEMHTILTAPDNKVYPQD